MSVVKIETDTALTKKEFLEASRKAIDTLRINSSSAFAQAEECYNLYSQLCRDDGGYGTLEFTKTMGTLGISYTSP